MSVADHQRADGLLPWLVNGRLQGEDLRWLNAHLEHCSHCKNALQEQRRVRDALASEPAVEFAPLASYHKLWSRIEDDASAIPASRAVAATRRRGWKLLVAGLAAQSVAIVALALALWQLHAASPPLYRTVTSPAPAFADGSILVVFDDATTLTELRTALSRAGLKIHDGPTAGGVYTLVRDPQRSGGSLENALGEMRAVPQVRFAERNAEQLRP